MKHILAALLLLFAFATAWAAPPASAPVATANGVKLDLINKLVSEAGLHPG